MSILKNLIFYDYLSFMKKMILPIVCTFTAFFMLFFASCTQNENTLTFNAMNTVMTLKTYGKNAKEVNLKIKDRILNLESYFSVTDKNSEVYKINSGTTQYKVLHDETSYLIKNSLLMAQKTNGTFNPAIYPIVKLWGFTEGNYNVPIESQIKNILPLTDFSKIKIEQNDDKKISVLYKEKNMMLDFGAVAKGYAGDEAVKILKKNKINSAILDLGGNIVAFNEKPNGEEWNVGIKNPWENQNACLGLKVKNKNIITSGGYERFFTDKNGNKYIHIFNAKTGYPVQNDLESVTIISENGFYADCLSTALFVMGKEDAINFWKNNNDFKMILITKNKEVYASKSLENKITVLYDFKNVTFVNE